MMLLKTIEKINEAGTIRLAESLARCHYKDEADAERDFELFNEGAKQMSDIRLASAKRLQSILSGDNPPYALIEEPINELLSLFNSDARPILFLHMFLDICSTSFWQALYENWSSFDLIPYFYFELLFDKHSGCWSPGFMNKDDRIVYDALPERVTIYRGQAAAARVGQSWTLDRSVAEGFARGHRGIRNAAPTVIKATVRKKNVAAVISHRRKSEIVLFRSRFAYGRSHELLTDVASRGHGKGV